MAKNAVRFAEHQNSVSASPEVRVVPVYWDPHFRNTPSDVAAFDEFLRMLFRSSWMSELSSYGLAPPRLLRAHLPKDDAPATLTRRALEQKLADWLASGVVSPKPKRNDSSLIFLVLTPCRTKLTPREAKSQSKSYHASAAFERDAIVHSDDPSQHNLIYSVVPLLSTQGEILERHSRAVCQALTQAVVRSVRKH
ncbi:MAG: hypothetical protein QM756_02245 [Polyangiaceae bacterium]